MWCSYKILLLLQYIVAWNHDANVNIVQSYCLLTNHAIGQKEINLSYIYKSITRASTFGGKFGVQNLLLALSEEGL